MKILREKGVELEEKRFVSSLKVLPKYLMSMNIKRLLLIGMEPVKRYLVEEGTEVVEDHQVQGVVVAQGTGALTFIS